MKKFIIAILILSLSPFAFGWDGYDWEKQNYIDIETVDGDSIEFYDYANGDWHDGTIEDWDYCGEIEVYDEKEQRYRYFDMD